ncbi:MAG: DUF4962 domain-containing protein, partial [Planctomycetes bacterium]|nr:DUF4962 domain-containing protein [Planctomycetota bacterium]
MRCVSIPLALSYILLAAALAEAGETVFSYDFEAGADLGKYPGLAIGETEAAIVPGGADGTGHALRFHNVKPGRYASVTIKQPFPVQKNLVLSFDHREEIEADKEAAYLGILFFDPEGKQWFGSDKFGPAWKHAEIELGKMNSSNQGVMTLGHVLERVNLYGRAKGDTQAIMTVWLDNVTLSVKTREGRLTDEERVSTANPPLFNWPRGEGEMKLEYWASPTGQTGQTGRTGRTGQTTIVTVPHNFHTPPAPLTPGLWHWRVWTSTPLTEGWSDTFRLRIVPEAHRFTTEPVPTAKIAASPHPRVIDLAAARRDTAGKTAEALVKQAESIHRTGVPPDPPRYAPGNPEWPTWIDWYGKVHGGITARTGRRLQTIAQLCALTRDPQVIAWTKEMAFAAAAWDPNGGSAMNAGDIGAHHLLRGLNWCYDALHGDLTADERAKLRAVIVTRAEQFAKRLNPFRGGEANNHAWLQAFGLAEAGFVLLGEHDQAAEWPEYVRQLYLGKFLCCLGYQGDNNEGIGYWGYGLSFIVDYADMMKHVCGIDLFRHPWLYQTARFPMYSAPP